MGDMSPAQTASLTNSDYHESMGNRQVGNIERLKLVSEAGNTPEVSVLKEGSIGIFRECEEGIAIVNASSDHEMKTSDAENSSGGSKLPGDVFSSECVPLWGSVSICGRRPEMEDSISVAPCSIRIPIKFLIGHSEAARLNHSGSHIPGHFFAVYDGHGGSQVANYCHGRIYRALEEELELTKNDLVNDNCLLHWETTFISCFAKVDDEVAGNVQRENASELDVAPPTVGSTATVALICSSHLIVANCGDSRAVLCRGKAAIALSIDHKPNREDEYARIEASGGRVIQWNGHRVLGVLAMSRSIGDRYLKPWIIPKPEVTFVARTKEDECVIIGSDGLWDVIRNEEACEVARKRILVWHKKNPGRGLVQKGGVDAAAQGAAEYLSALALQRGSKDNISVIVVDLKTHRKFKKRSSE